MHRFLRVLLALAPALLGASALADCNLGPRPAATLLIPYFEVDLVDPSGRTTLFAVGNAGAGRALAHVVLWTDWGIPTFAFDIHLERDDVQTVNLRDVFAGSLPVTGGPGFTACTDPLTQPPLGPAEQARLVQQHTGAPDDGNLCSGSGRAGAGIATGYVTIDAMNGCSATIRYPTDEVYFAAGGTGLASNDNVLFGDFFHVDGVANFAQGGEAVHIIADAERFGSGGRTFYGRLPLATGLDERAPLPTRHRARYMNGGAFSGGTSLVVWAEPSLFFPEAVPCGDRGDYVDICQGLLLAPFDEHATAGQPNMRGPVTEVAARIEVGGAEMPVAAPFGLLDVANFTTVGCFILPIGVEPLQSWVLPLHRAAGRFSVGLNAIRTADELCPPPP